ncbi:uracil-DNA glycosylase [Patescibacteria group bacterium]|nr:MAG: uracil-DNA glycosylase [Patescibacteria group bacterium]
MEIDLEESWKTQLKEEFVKEYFPRLIKFIKESYENRIVFPEQKYIFRAFNVTPFEKVKVVILGQDPYHGKGQANGLSFAVSNNVKIPPSLQNIFKEVESDLGKKLVHTDGDLIRWARQGVLLLNATLTVDPGKPLSHKERGWEEFTDRVIQKLSEKRDSVVFILWGNYAKAKGVHIDRTKHLVLESPHPSPFSAYGGFFGSRPFSKTNAYLTSRGIRPIQWL